MSIFIVGLFVVVGFVVFVVISKNDLGIKSLNDTEQKKSNVVPSKSIYSTETVNEEEKSSPDVLSSSENEISIEDKSNTSDSKDI